MLVAVIVSWYTEFKISWQRSTVVLFKDLNSHKKLILYKSLGIKHIQRN
jgi:hypothetical protein